MLQRAYAQLFHCKQYRLFTIFLKQDNANMSDVVSDGCAQRQLLQHTQLALRNVLSEHIWGALERSIG
jgi:hypothetical protein